MSKLLVSLLIACACSCSDNKNSRCEDIENKEARQQCIDQRDTPVTPTPTPIPVARTYTVEYRVIGTARRANIIYVNDIYGSNELSTGLPFFSNFQTNHARVFVSLFAQAEGEGAVRVQILVDGVLFREGSTDGFFGSSVEVSGTVVHPDTLPVSQQVRK
jgi:hypothetical protein